jgi:hypothetical protein
MLAGRQASRTIRWNETRPLHVAVLLFQLACCTSSRFVCSPIPRLFCWSRFTPTCHQSQARKLRSAYRILSSRLPAEVPPTMALPIPDSSCFGFYLLLAFENSFRNECVSFYFKFYTYFPPKMQYIPIGRNLSCRI